MDTWMIVVVSVVAGLVSGWSGGRAWEKEREGRMPGVIRLSTVRHVVVAMLKYPAIILLALYFAVMVLSFIGSIIISFQQPAHF